MTNLRLTPAQRMLLERLDHLGSKEFHTAGDLELPMLKNTGAALSRLAIRCLVQPEGKAGKPARYRITGLGQKAISK